MSFNSFTFLAFLIIVYALYLALARSVRQQNALLLVASYVFYGYWDWRFLGLLAFTTFVDYQVGRGLGRNPDARARRRLMWLSCLVNLGVLGFFKYFDFFAGSAAALLGALGLRADLPTLHVILPIGISFYTFQSLSYTIDVYRGELQPTDSLLDFATFVAFFPQLVAGPIERATALLPRVAAPRTVTAEGINAGLYLMLWGYGKKVVMADHLGRLAQQCFDPAAPHHGWSILAGLLAFTFQIYGDFSGYSDIARGVARLFGFELMVNFRLPYFAVSPRDFWARWHISLSTWLRDYLYIPLGGNRQGARRTYRNLLLTMLLGGLWHGAAWHFVAWGAYHGLLLVAFRLAEQPEELPLTRWSFRRRLRRAWARLDAHFVIARRGGYWALRVAGMFGLTVFGWLLFRAPTLGEAGALLGRLCQPGGMDPHEWLTLAVFAGPVLLGEAYQHARGEMLAVLAWPPRRRAVLYTLLLAWLVLLGARQQTPFIYFQF